MQGHYYDDQPQTDEDFVRDRTKTLIEVPSDAPKYFRVLIPFRILTFLFTLAFLILLIYITSHNVVSIRDPSALLMIPIVTSFMFFTILHVIGHCGSTETVEFPMIFGSFIGMICFCFLGFIGILGNPTATIARLTACIFSFIIGFLHGIDVLLTLAYWRYKYNWRKKLGPTRPMHSIYDSQSYNNQTSPPYIGKAYKNDVQTSMNDTAMIRDPYDDDDLSRTHRTKRSQAASIRSQPYVERPGRNEYYMMPTKAMQSNYSPIQRGAQTSTIDMRETPVQTSSKNDLYYHHMQEESHSQYDAPPYETQTLPMHSTPKSSPRRQNNICVCKHSTNYGPPLNATAGPTAGERFGSCNCSSLTSSKKSPVHHQHHHHHEPRQTPPRRVDTTGTNPNFDMNLNVGLDDKKHVKGTRRVYEAHPSPSWTKPFIGRLAAISGCLTAPSSSSLLVHKNKRTQTKKLSGKKQSNAVEKTKSIGNSNSYDHEEIDEEKFVAKEVEVRNVDLNSSQKVIPKHDSTRKKKIPEKSYGLPTGRRVIEVKEKKNDNVELKPKPDIPHKESNDAKEWTPMTTDPSSHSKSSKTRTKTLYRETTIKLGLIESDGGNGISRISNKCPSDKDQKTLNETIFPQDEKQTITNTKASPLIEEAASSRPGVNTVNKNGISETKEKLKNIGLNEAFGGTGWRFRIRTNSGSKQFRPDELCKTTSTLNPSDKDSTQKLCREIATDESKAESGLIRDEIFKQFSKIKNDPKANEYNTGPSVYD